MNNYKYTIIYQDCCSTKKILETKPEFHTEEDARKDAAHFLAQNYPELDRYHFQIIVLQQA